MDPKTLVNGSDPGQASRSELLTDAVDQILNRRSSGTDDTEPSGGEIVVGGTATEDEDDRFFDPDFIRSAPNFADNNSKKVHSEILVKRPHKLTPIRINPSPQYRVFTYFLDVKEERETFLVSPELVSLAPKNILTGATLLLWVNERMTPFFLIAPEPPEKGLGRQAATTLKECVEWAMKTWVRIVWNTDTGRYEAFQAAFDLPEPRFPNEPMKQLIKLGFKDRLIRSTDHPAWQKYVAHRGVLNSGDGPL